MVEYVESLLANTITSTSYSLDNEYLSYALLDKL